MSDQPTGAHPPADHDSQPTPDPYDALAGPSDASDPLSSELYSGGPSPSERDESQRAAAPTSAPEPARSEPADPAQGPLVPQGPPVPQMTPPPGRTEAGPSAGPPAEPPKAGRRFSPVLKRLAVVLVGVVVVVVGRTAFDRGSADVLEVGQCVSRDGNEISEVDCADAEARYKVLLIQKDTNESAIESVCSAAADTTTSYFESKEGETKGNVICLADLT